MSVSRTAIGSALAVILVATSITPAMARGGWGGWGGWGKHYRKHRDNDTGEVLAGVLIGAVLVGALSSASKKKAARDARVSDRDYPQNSRDTDYDRRDDRTQGDIRSEDAAVDACALAAEDRVGTTASVRDITSVTRSNDGWDVQGIVESRTGWRDRSAERRKFSCLVRFGLVDSVSVEDARVAFRQ
jgi:hypothetical protein